MQLPIFIKIENTLEKALYYRYSPQMKFLSYEGVQLLPYNEYPYIQRTYADEGIELETFTVYVCDACSGKRLHDITDNFEVIRNFQDEDTGLPQIEWSLKNVAYDAGYRIVYLEIVYGAGYSMFSSRFMLTAENSEYTSRWDYRNDDEDTMLSTQLQIYFRQPKSEKVITNYKPVTSGYEVTASAYISPYERWFTKVVDIFVIEMFANIFTCRQRYCDLLGCSLKEAPETPDFEADENFAEQELFIIRNNSVVYDPLYVPVVPPEPEPGEPTITLLSVVSVNNNQVQFTWEYEDFSPDYISLEYGSSPTGPWTANTGVPTSPRTIPVPSHLTSNYYYRVFHFGTGLESNVLQLAQKTITIDNITSPDSSFIQTGNAYNVSYTVSNFTSTQFSVYGSTDNINWIPMYYNTIYENPKPFFTPSSSTEFKYFRIQNDAFGVVSNVFFFEF